MLREPYEPGAPGVLRDEATPQPLAALRSRLPPLTHIRARCAQVQGHFFFHKARCARDEGPFFKSRAAREMRKHFSKAARCARFSINLYRFQAFNAPRASIHGMPRVDVRVSAREWLSKREMRPPEPRELAREAERTVSPFWPVLYFS